ncbi:MAG: hypothetical protein ACXVLQ_08480 [Bacteriovorax sp.]
MAKFFLVPFDKHTAPDIKIEVELNNHSESLFLSFRIKEGLSLIDLGSSTPRKERTMQLWEKTCFEFFLKNEEGSYVEFNFSPNFEWNCFYFQKKGDAIKEWETMNRPATEILLSIDHYFLFVEMRKELFPKGFFDTSTQLQAGITSVIKDVKGGLSYWALTHKDTRPNFHQFDSFTITL